MQEDQGEEQSLPQGLTHLKEDESKVRYYWGEIDSGEFDGLILTLDQLGQFRSLYANYTLLAEVFNPLARALAEGVEVHRLFDREPSYANLLFDKFVALTEQDILSAMEYGVDGIFYRLVGATPAICTPMQYAGLSLERDRELLQRIEEDLLRVVFLDGESQIYMDFVSDLPADYLAWDARTTNLSVQACRGLCAKKLMTNDPHADAILVFGESD
jgi:hypothetical protein